jgi:hypothetical protein
MKISKTKNQVAKQSQKKAKLNDNCIVENGAPYGDKQPYQLQMKVDYNSLLREGASFIVVEFIPFQFKTNMFSSKSSKKVLQAALGGSRSDRRAKVNNGIVSSPVYSTVMPISSLQMTNVTKLSGPGNRERGFNSYVTKTSTVKEKSKRQQSIARNRERPSEAASTSTSPSPPAGPTTISYLNNFASSPSLNPASLLDAESYNTTDMYRDLNGSTNSATSAATLNFDIPLNNKVLTSTISEYTISIKFLRGDLGLISEQKSTFNRSKSKTEKVYEDVQLAGQRTGSRSCKLILSNPNDSNLRVSIRREYYLNSGDSQSKIVSEIITKRLNIPANSLFFSYEDRDCPPYNILYSVVMPSGKVCSTLSLTGESPNINPQISLKSISQERSTISISNVPDITSYIIYKRSLLEQNFTPLNSSLYQGETTISQNITLFPGESYEFYAQLIDINGISTETPKFRYTQEIINQSQNMVVSTSAIAGSNNVIVNIEDSTEISSGSVVGYQIEELYEAGTIVNLGIYPLGSYTITPSIQNANVTYQVKQIIKPEEAMMTGTLEAVSATGVKYTYFPSKVYETFNSNSIVAMIPADTNKNDDDVTIEKLKTVDNSGILSTKNKQPGSFIVNNAGQKIEQVAGITISDFTGEVSSANFSIPLEQAPEINLNTRIIQTGVKLKINTVNSKALSGKSKIRNYDLYWNGAYIETIDASISTYTDMDKSRLSYVGNFSYEVVANLTKEFNGSIQVRAKSKTYVRK